MKKFFKFVLNFLLYSLLLCYAFVGISAAWTLYKKEINSRQSLSDLTGVIQTALEEGRPSDVTAWVHLRPQDETAALIDAISPQSGQLDPYVFFELSARQMRLGHEEDAFFWHQLGRYRMRYDVLRCGAPDGVEVLDRFLALFPSDKFQDTLQKRPELLKKSIRQVLDFDAKYPAENDPASFCAAIDKLAKSNVLPATRQQWDGIRGMLRSVSEKSLKEMDGQQP